MRIKSEVPVRAVVAAGGSGTRLWPLTQSVNKHLLPVFDKPMIHYPLSTVALAGISEVAIVTTPEALTAMQDLAEGLTDLGFHIDVLCQAEARGVADVLLTALDWLEGREVLFSLGDNFFWGAALSGLLKRLLETEYDASVLAVKVQDPSAYAVLEHDESGRPRRIIEKPQGKGSRLAIPGLYRYTASALNVVRELEPSTRGELEITDLNQLLLDEGRLEVVEAPRGLTWLDLGSFHDLHEAASLVKIIQDRQGLQVGSLEEISLRQGWSTTATVRERLLAHDSPYSRKLLSQIEDRAQ